MPAFLPGPVPIGTRLPTLAAGADPPEPAAPEKVAAEDVRVLPQPERHNLDAVNRAEIKAHIAKLLRAGSLLHWRDCRYCDALRELPLEVQGRIIYTALDKKGGTA